MVPVKPAPSKLPVPVQIPYIAYRLLDGEISDDLILLSVVRATTHVKSGSSGKLKAGLGPGFLVSPLKKIRPSVQARV